MEAENQQLAKKPSETFKKKKNKKNTFIVCSYSLAYISIKYTFCFYSTEKIHLACLYNKL